MDALGLINVIIVIVLTALWWGLYDEAHPPPDSERDPLRSLAMSSMFVGGLTQVHSASVVEGLDDVLGRIGKAGGYNVVFEFIEGARQAYELIVGAFARGDLDSIAHLLTDQVRDDFETFLKARRERGETEFLTFIGFSGTDIVAASFEDMASISVRFSAEIVSATRDHEGRLIAGNPDRVVQIAEIWTFERDTMAREPHWLVAATDADE